MSASRLMWHSLVFLRFIGFTLGQTPTKARDTAAGWMESRQLAARWVDMAEHDLTSLCRCLGGWAGREGCCCPPRVWLFHCGCPSSCNPGESRLITAGPISSNLCGDEGRATAELRFSWEELLKCRWHRDLWPPHYMKCQLSCWSSHTCTRRSTLVFIMSRGYTNLCICFQVHDNEKDISLCGLVRVCGCGQLSAVSRHSYWNRSTWKLHNQTAPSVWSCSFQTWEFYSIIQKTCPC